MSLPRYTDYKNSGSEWLGDIPSHWSTRRFKWLIERSDGGVWGDEPLDDDGTIVLRSTEQSIDGRWTLNEPARRKLTESERLASTLEEGDLLVTKSSGSSLHIGKTTLVDSRIASLRCCYSNFMQRIRLTYHLVPKLAWYMMNNGVVRTQFDVLSNSTTGLANLNGSIVGEILIPVGNPYEQTAIVRFLDRETAKIDALIAEQEKLIALLAEKRHATISHAVTRGLNPDVPMKDSGVAWLGEVPAHWSITRLKFLASVQTGIAKGKDIEGKVTINVPYLRVANVQDGFLALDDVTSIDIEPAQLDRYRLRPGDVLMNEGGDFDKLGRGAIWNGEIQDCIHQNHVFAVRPHAISSKWLNHITSSSYARFYFMSLSKQSTNLASISSSNIMELLVPSPPYDEQAEISQFIAREMKRISTLEIEAGRSIVILNERRSALISAAVTGQIDVRDVAVKISSDEKTKAI